MSFRSRFGLRSVVVGFGTLLVGMLVLGGAFVYAQEDLPPRLEEGLKPIVEPTVKEIVSFLASDEMKGRDTPSPELTRAGEYVADQFKSAGLVGGAADGTFFEKSTIKTIAFPFDEIKCDAEGKPQEHFGLFAAGKEDVHLEGVPAIFDANNPKIKLSGIAIVDVTDLTGRGAAIRTGSRIAAAQQSGAEAVLLVTKPDSPLIATAQRARRPRLVRRRSRISIPALLVTSVKKDANYQLSVPAAKPGETEVANVIGLIRGSDEALADEAIIFTAHLDHIGFQPGLPDPVFNGADDDASGVTGVLMLAKAFGALKQKPKRTVIFMAFWGEEKGLLGSKQYTSKPTWPLDKIVANINLEMIGRPEGGAHNKCWMTGWDQSNLGSELARGAKRVGVEVFNHPRFSAMLYRASDNFSFVKKGVIAHSFSAGSMHSDYHQVTDHWQKLELKHMTQVIRGVFAGSLPLADGEWTPQKAKR